MKEEEKEENQHGKLASNTMVHGMVWHILAWLGFHQGTLH